MNRDWEKADEPGEERWDGMGNLIKPIECYWNQQHSPTGHLFNWIKQSMSACGYLPAKTPRNACYGVESTPPRPSVVHLMMIQITT